MKLYYLPGACSMSPHIALRESGLAFDLHKLDYATHTAGGVDYSTINPKGYVPTLQLNSGQVITEGPAIVQYIADQVPDTGLAPPWGSFERYRLIEWLNFINTELHSGLGALFNTDRTQAPKKSILDWLARRFGFVNQQLAGKTYLVGDRFTVADGHLFWALHRANHLEVDLTPFTVARAYFARIGQRPKVKEVLTIEGPPPEPRVSRIHPAEAHERHLL